MVNGPSVSKSIVSEGGIRFSDDHTLIGAGFQPMFDARAATRSS
jgi:hypothetical protein